MRAWPATMRRQISSRQPNEEGNRPVFGHLCQSISEPTPNLIVLAPELWSMENSSRKRHDLKVDNLLLIEV